MKLHLFDALHSHPEWSDNLKYGTVLVVGIPAAVYVSRHVIQFLFNLVVG